MTANPYGIPVEELESRVRVPVDAQVQEQAEPQVPVVERHGPLYPYGDDGGPVDGD